MKIAVLGTGTVGRTIAGKLVDLGHEVRMGSRHAGGDAAVQWAADAGERASEGSFADAASYGEITFNCTNGAGSVAAVTSAVDDLRGKVLIDVANPLDLSGDSPTLFVGVSDSLAEQIQRVLPETLVVKALNTVNAGVMVDPDAIPGDHVVFVCGDDGGAKAAATKLLREFGWPTERVIDLGELAAARATETYLLLWLRLMGKFGAGFNLAIERSSD